jgi:hypothetical protein
MSLNPTRHQFKHGDRLIYEWEQTLDEVNIYIVPPAGISAKDLDVRISPTILFVGLKNANVQRGFIHNEEFGGLVDQSSSLWTLDSGELSICLTKARPGETWNCALKSGASLSPLELQKSQQEILKERFQRENPGFDFSGAEFSGMAPDARNFLGGIDYNKLSR